MRLAYLILAHDNPGQLRRLVCRLSDTDTDIYIHLDQKAEAAAAFLNISGLCKNVFFIRRRADVKWGAFSMVKATLNGLAEIVEHGSYDYVNLLSGMDYPIKSNREIADFFIKNRGREFLHYRENPSRELPLGGSDRFEYFYDYDNMFTNKNEYELEMRIRGSKRSFIAEMKPYHGSQWWSLTGACIAYILGQVALYKELSNFYRYTKFPDEQFFQTIIMNSGFSYNVVNNNLRYINWPQVDWSAIDWVVSKPHPKILTLNDFYNLKHSTNLFARKFHQNTDTVVMNLIDRLLL